VRNSAAARRLATALTFPTIAGTAAADSSFTALGKHLEKSFPRVHSTLTVTTFGHSRLYRWAGRTPEHVGALLLAHLDVVPVGDPPGWTHPPFAGIVDNEFVWGRGAIDDKSRVLAILEAAEAALTAGFAPTSTLYFAFGHDEETSGEAGAAVMAGHLRDQGVCADFVLDEGGVVTSGVARGISQPVASIALGEKGYATVRVSVTDAGGHSSMPPRRTAVGRVAQAVARIQDNPMPLRLTPPILEMLRRLGPVLPEPQRTLLRTAAYVPGTGKAIARVIAGRPETEALVRTTTAPTVISGGVAANVLPQYAEALINFRILQGDSTADVLRHCQAIVADDAVTVELTGPANGPSRVSPASGAAFELLAATARAVLPDAVIATGIVPAATDSGRYDVVAKHRYNFAPVVLTGADLRRIHGTDERISHANYTRLIEFNRLLITSL
jgi:carboxypeptidase PM20D1